MTRTGAIIASAVAGGLDDRARTCPADLPIQQRDMLPHVVNERLDELITQHRASYSRVLRQSEPTTGLLGMSRPAQGRRTMGG